jgi:hypothetical protein
MRWFRWFEVCLLLSSACHEGKTPLAAGGADAGTPSEEEVALADAGDGIDADDSEDDAAASPRQAEDRDTGSASTTMDRDAALARSDAALASDAEAGALGASDAGSDASMPPSPTATYSVMRYIGGYDHLHIIMRDEPRGYCVRLSLYFPAPPSSVPSGLALPENWGLETSAAVTPADGCTGATDGAVVMNQLPLSGAVRIRRASEQQAPCSIDVDVTLRRTLDAGLMVDERLLALDLAVPCD